jgi:hypothetical protein
LPYDDLVTAIACPIWFSEGKMRHLVREPLPPREVIEPYRPPTFDQVFKRHQKRVRPDRAANFALKVPT